MYGGSKSGIWKEMLSEVFNLTVKTSNCTDGAALGAAILAGLPWKYMNRLMMPVKILSDIRI